MAFQIFRRFGVERLRKVFWTFAILDTATPARLDHDIHDDSKTENVVRIANVVDLALIVLLLGVYFLERLVKEDIEQALSRSVDDLRASNLRLQDLTTASNRQL